MAARTVFIFDGHEFALESCSINASLPDPYWCDKFNRGNGKSLRWSIEFSAEEQEVDEDLIAPSIEIDDLPIQPSDWKQLAGTSAKWTRPVNPHTDDRYGMTYVHDHNLITQGHVGIGARRGTTFRVSVTGTDEEGQTFEVAAPVPFEGVHVSASERDSAKIIKERLAEVLNISNLSASRFKLDGTKYGSGVWQR